MEREAASEGERANQIHCFWRLSGEGKKEEEEGGGGGNVWSISRALREEYTSKSKSMNPRSIDRQRGRVMSTLAVMRRHKERLEVNNQEIKATTNPF
jgi:hypothetical protein